MIWVFLALSAGAGEKSINVGMIPGAGATQVSIQEKAPLQTYSSRKMGREVNLIIPTNYNATVSKKQLAIGNGTKYTLGF